MPSFIILLVFLYSSNRILIRFMYQHDAVLKQGFLFKQDGSTSTSISLEFGTILDLGRYNNLTNLVSDYY